MNQQVNRQIVFERLGQVGVHDAPAPRALGPDEVLVRPAFIGVCGTDLHVLHGKHPWVKPPLVTGHEMAGVVEHAGHGGPGLQGGDLVVLDPLVPCGGCRRCQRGAFNTCENAKVIGFRLPGAAQTAFVTRRQQLHRVPAGLDLRRAVLAEPLAVGVHASTLWDDLAEVLVIGGGAIGLCVLAALKARGAGSVTVVEPVAAKRELALRLGAAEAVAPGAVGPVPRFTATFDVVAAQPTLDLAGAATLSGGAVVVVGVAPGAMAVPLPRMQRFEVTLKGSGMYLGRDIEEALRLLATGAVDAGAFITGCHGLDDAAGAYAAAAQPGSVKTLIRMD